MRFSYKKLVISVFYFILVFLALISYFMFNNLELACLLFFSLIIVILINSKIELFDLLIFTLPFMFYIHFPFTINISMADFIAPIIFFKFFLYKDTENSYDKRLNSILKYGLVLIWIMCLSLINIITLESPLLLGGLVSIFKIFICLAYGLITIRYLEMNEKERFLKVWFYSGITFCIIMIIGVICYYFGLDLGLTFAGTFRATGTFEDPNLAAAYLFIISSFMGDYCLQRKNIFLIIFTLGILFTCILLTSSKGAIVALSVGGISILIYSLLRIDFKKVSLILMIYILIGIIVVEIYHKYSFVQEIFEPIFNRLNEFLSNVEGDHSLEHRKFLWDIAFKLGVHHPLLGVGVEQFRPAASEFTRTNIWNIVHNTYLTFWAETGIIGTIAFLWLPIKLFFQCLGNLKKNNSLIIYLFSITSIAVSMYSISLQNFRVLWVFIAYLIYELYSIELIKKRKVICANDS